MLLSPLLHHSVIELRLVNPFVHAKYVVDVLSSVIAFNKSVPDQRLVGIKFRFSFTNYE